jgi:hypothetical protein
MINVIIPTANRPGMLRQALRSVRAQTVRDRISRVLVSESGGNPESGQVCAAFPELPICYVLRDPPLTSLAHTRALLNEGLPDQFTAILHDDDWWMPEHLANAFEALQNDAEAVAYYSSCYYVSGESTLLRSNDNLFFWFGAGYPELAPVWHLGRREVAIASLLGTPCSYSTLVANTEAFRKAWLVVSETTNRFDSDRMLVIELATYGPILYRPFPEVFIRQHPAQDARTFGRASVIHRMSQTTDWLLGRCGESVRELSAMFVERVHRCPPGARPSLHPLVLVPWAVSRLAAHPDAAPQLHQLLRSLRPMQVKEIVRPFVPPIIFQGGRHLWRWLNRMKNQRSTRE